MRTLHVVSLGVSILVVGCSQYGSQTKNNKALLSKASAHNMPTRREVVGWGARRVTIELIEVGSYHESLKILKPRCHVAYVRRMVQKLETKI